MLSLLLPANCSSNTEAQQQLLLRLLLLQSPLYAGPLSSLFNRFPEAVAAALLLPLLSETGQQQLQQQQLYQYCGLKEALLELLLQHLEISSARPLR